MTDPKDPVRHDPEAQPPRPDWSQRPSQRYQRAWRLTADEVERFLKTLPKPSTASQSNITPSCGSSDCPAMLGGVCNCYAGG